MDCTIQTVERAFQLVFGESSTSALHIQNVDADELKSAFRKKALFFHPDRAGVLGLSETDLTELFKHLHGAYRLLQRVITDDILIDSTSLSSIKPKRQGGVKRAGADKRNKHPFGEHFSSSRYRGTVPERELRFAQYLYYSGIIDWQTVISAVAWQFQKRLKVGEIGRNYRFISNYDIIKVIRNRGMGELFGDAAIRLRLIDRFKLNVMLGKQRNLNCPIGKYFVENRILTARDIDTLLDRSKKHNHCVRYNRTP